MDFKAILRFPAFNQKDWKAVWFIVIVFTFASCRDDRWDVDTSDVKTDIEIKRFEDAVFNADTSAEGLHKLVHDYRDMMELLVEQMLRMGDVDKPENLELFKRVYLENEYHDSLYSDIKKKYTDTEIENIETSLEDAFSRIKYFLKVDTLPQVYTMVTGFGYQAVTYENNLGISLDLFMGSDYRYYPSLEFADYQTRRFRKEYIVPEAMKALFIQYYDERKYTDKTLLSRMIYAGKKLYFLDVILPETDDTLKIGYTENQLEWAEDNQPEIWNYFAEKDMFYTTEEEHFVKFLNDAPYTVADGVPPESAPRLGEWVGWQIVKHYMDRHRDVSLDELFRDNDYRKILKESRYRP